MARKIGSTIVQEELYPPSTAPTRESHAPRMPLDGADARLLDLDVDEESPFLRGQKRVPARRNSLPRKTANRLLWTAMAVALACTVAVATAALYEYGQRSWRFRVESSDNIEVSGTQNVSKAQIMEVMGADIGRNIFFVPLAQQKTQLEQIPWVESASVMRFVPNRLQVEIHERTPVAFARVGPRIALIDASGVLMDLPQKRKYSFPVILGMNPGEPLSTRAPRMKAYNQLVQDLDSGGARYSQDLSEVDLSDLEDIKVRVNDPAGDVQVHLGASDYLHRYRIYVGHVREWRQQFQKLESVDLRYDNQIIVNPDLPESERKLAVSPASGKAAGAAGVKQASLITPMGPNRALPEPAFKLTQKNLDAAGGMPKPAANGPEKVKAKRAAGEKFKVAFRRRGKKTTTGQRPIAGRSAQTARSPVASSRSPKPSPAIAKQQDQD